jgi:phenylacetate-CoA ligase
MVIVRGVNIYPTAVEQIVRGVPEITEYRATYDTRPALHELSLEVEATPAVADELERRLQAGLALRVPVTTVAPGYLPRFELKARRWRKL